MALNFNILGSAVADSAPDIEDFSINELMQMEVSSASRKSQTVSDTAAAAFVISQEDIRRSGATSIPDALRLAPGLEVAQINASVWAVTARGFNGRYANKLLVLMDGRTVYTPLFSGVFWDLQDTLMEDIDRIEVIRGPGAVMWGANAVNGVINIITKKAKDTQGNLFVAGGGNQERGFAGYRHGGRVGDDGSYRVYAKTFERDTFVSADGNRLHDDWRSVQGGFRIDDRISNDSRYTVQGDVYRKNVGNTVPAQTVAPPFNTPFNVDEHAEGANLLARWEGNLGDGSEFMLQGYYDRVNFSAAALSDSQDMLDIDFQHRLHPNSDHDLMWGASYRFIHSAATNSAAISFNPNSLGYHNGSVFVQDDITLIDDTLRLTLGTKLEESHFGNTQVQPNARLMWTPDPKHSVWASVSRAARTPSRGEAQANIALGSAPPPFTMIQVMGQPDPNLRAEKVFAAEIGYRTQWTDKISTDITAFSNHYTDLIMFRQGVLDLTTLTQPMIWYNNTREVTTRGIEIAGEWQALDWMRFTGNYSHLKIERPYDTNNPDIAGLSPRHRGSLRWQMDLPEKIKLDLTLRHVGKLAAVGQEVQAYTTFDARLAYEPYTGLELAVIAQNLFSPRHPEYRDSSAISLPGSALEVPRSIYGKLSWRF
ncbi:iron complex outermembrane receptor protein [Methylomonas methanica]|uniref:TonB-dependent receptor n=3 Tax=Methylococcaceae TaxID=403 RepID=A0A126T620_9GAMM|nr:TonB-dependent receptor [Methylomonas denitrificans]OAI05100.1 TonB-dependent receptor [Methylomonas methanica]TCV84440.1 iron complex outermembrane receptor protein [Methylomonas methanica]